MKEIDKLRQRLSNISRNSTEYKMTIREAKSLIEEFEELEKQIKEKSITIDNMKDSIENIPTTIVRTLDGGSF